MKISENRADRICLFAIVLGLVSAILYDDSHWLGIGLGLVTMIIILFVAVYEEEDEP